MKCPLCNSEMIWGNDFDWEDIGREGEGVSAGTGAMTAQYGAVTLLRISSDVWTASGAIGTVA